MLAEPLTLRGAPDDDLPTWFPGLAFNGATPLYDAGICLVRGGQPKSAVRI